MLFNLFFGVVGGLLFMLSRLLSRYAAASWHFYKNDPYSNVDGSWLCFLQLVPRFFLFLGYFCWAFCLVVDLYCLVMYYCFAQ